MNVAELITTAAVRYGPRVAFIDGKQRVTFSEFDSLVNALAHGMLRHGLAKGDRVALVFSNSLRGIEANWAGYKSGIVPVSINSRQPDSEIARQLTHSASAVVFCADEYYDRLCRVLVAMPSAPEIVTPSGVGRSLAWDRLTGGCPATPPQVEISADDELHQSYGSGTTGLPKCFVETHRRTAYLARLFFYEFDAPVLASDVMVHVAPVNHASGVYVLPHFMRGAINCLQEQPRLELFVETVRRVGGTRTLMVPTMLRRLLAEELATRALLPTLRHVVYTSAPMDEALLRECIGRFGCIFEQVYGFAEYGVVTVLPIGDHPDSGHGPWPRHAGSAGRPIAGTRIAMRDSNGLPVAPGEAGEICVKGPGLFPGYWRDPERTAQAMTDDGYYRSGDVGAMDEDGRLYLLDRVNNMIITGGYNVYPASLEAILNAAPEVIESAVFGAPDEDWGERVVAAVVLRDPASDRDRTAVLLRDYCRRHLAAHEVPKQFVFVDDLPKSHAGKILHRELREPFWKGRARAIH